MSKSLRLVSTRECLGFGCWSKKCSGCGILHCGVCCLCSKEEADGDQGQACFQLVAKVSSILKMFQNRAWVNRRLTKFSWRRWSWSVLSSPHFWFSFTISDMHGCCWCLVLLGFLIHKLWRCPLDLPQRQKCTWSGRKLFRYFVEILNYPSGVLLKLKNTYGSYVCACLDNHWVQRAGQTVERRFWDWIHHRAIWGVPHRSR